jgi:predicted RNA-binding Zn ribbon-like protein
VIRIDFVDELPSWYPGATETKPAPMPLLLVQGFVNTRDLEDATDLLELPETARQWLLDTGLLDRRARLDESELELAREVREALRALLDGDRADGCLEPLHGLTLEGRARLTVAQDGAVGLENAGHGEVRDGLFELLLIVHRAQDDGSWSRLKICANEECQWAFFDRSRNQQGNWCNMAVCGNRLKNRELRARRR